MQNLRKYFLHFIGGCVAGVWAANASLLLTGLRPNKDLDNFYPLLPALCLLLIVPVLILFKARRQPLRQFTHWSCLAWLLPCGFAGYYLLPFMVMANIGLQAS
jgi:hypothetical protein